MYIQNIQEFIKNHPIEKLTYDEAKQIYEKIVDDLNYHNWLYYVKSNPVISDYEYDLLFHYLEDLEKKYPNLIKPYSPTQRLTNQIQSELKKEKHKYPLLSLENTYSEEDVKEFIDRIKRALPEAKDLYFYVEPKYDGLSIELVYKNWNFVKAITRWDWIIWEDVTENAKTIRTLPLKIPYKWELHVRWEVVIRKSEFEKVNKEREKLWLSLYSNPRNLASGSLRQLDPSITRERNLDVITYEILNINDFSWFIDDTEWFSNHLESYNNHKESLFYHHESLDFLEKQWFFVYDLKNILEKNKEKYLDNPDFNFFYNLFKIRKPLTEDQIIKVVKSNLIKEILDKEDIEFDGLVIKLDNIEYYPILWSTEHHPRWAFAFKYPAKQVTSQILDVELSVWRTWIITPVAILEPVEIWWVVVKRATLHNFDFIKEKDIHIWDYVWVQRSGEVIPYIVEVIKERRNNEENWGLKAENLDINELINYYDKLVKEKNAERNDKISYLHYLEKFNLANNDLIEYWNLIKIIEPPYCPVCWWETFHPENEVALRCINVACPAQVKEKIVHFVSKHWLDIEWLSEKTVELFLKTGLIKDYWDIFYLPEKKNEILALPGFQQKKVENIINAIENKKEVELDKFLAAIWIEFVWKKTAKLIQKWLEETNLIHNFLIENKYIDFKKLANFLASDKWQEFLLSINGIWPKVAESIKKFFIESHNQKVLDKLLKKVKIIYNQEKKWKFFWKSFVITWSIEWISRDKIAKFIEDNWWEFSNQVTQHTTLLLVWEKPGKSKLEKAKKYWIWTYDLQKFLEENGFNLEKEKKEISLF